MNAYSDSNYALWVSQTVPHAGYVDRRRNPCTTALSMPNVDWTYSAWMEPTVFGGCEKN
jgi:hypothetical protein